MLVTFNDKITLSNDAAHWYIELAAEEEVSEFDLFEIVLENYYEEHKGEDE